MVSGEAPEDEWKANFRISRESFAPQAEIIRLHVQVRFLKIKRDVFHLK